MAASSSNLKSTFKRHIREGSDLQTAAATELFKELIQRARGRSRAGEPLKKRLAKLALCQPIVEPPLRRIGDQYRIPTSRYALVL